MIYRFNAVFFTILAVQSLILLISACVPMLRVCVACCHCCCTNIIHLVMLIMTLVFRFNSTGDNCSKNTQMYAEGRTFAEDGDTLKSLSIATMCLWLVFGCFTCCTILPGQFKQTN